MDAQAPNQPAPHPGGSEGPKRKGPRHARPRGRAPEWRLIEERRAAAEAPLGPERRTTEERRTSEERHEGRERRSGIDRRTRTERRSGAERRSGSDRRDHGHARIDAGTPHRRMDLHHLVLKARTYLSAVALSLLAAVGSYAGTYRVMELLFSPAVVAPVATALTPSPAAAHQVSPPENPAGRPPGR